MRRAFVVRWICAVVFAGVALRASVVRADNGSAPERLLAADSILYWRFDGWTPHQSAYNQTAFADVLHAGLADFLDSCQQLACKQISDDVLSQTLLAGKRASELKVLHGAVKQIPLLWPAIEQHGIVLGVEASGKRQSARLTIVLPQGKPLYLVARLLANQFADAPVERHIKGRLVLVSEPQFASGALTDQTAGAASNQPVQIGKPTAPPPTTPPTTVSANPPTHEAPQTAAKPTNEPNRLLAWSEGNDLVIVVAAERSDEMVGSVLDRRERNLLANPLYKEAAAFKDYETLSHGFVDFQPALREAAKTLGFDDVQKTVAGLGLDGLRQMVWHTGVEGRHQRYTIDLAIPNPREGILRVFDGDALTAAEHLPALPPDQNQFHLFSLRPEDTFVVLRTAAYAIASAMDDEPSKAILANDDSLRAAAKKLGIDLQRDLFDCLGPRLLVYSSPSDGPLFTGAGVALQVRNAEKLQKVLAQLAELAAPPSGAQYRIVHRNCRGVDLVSLRAVASNGDASFMGISPVMPSYAIHKGWLVIALNPQTIDGFILRSASPAPLFSPDRPEPALAQGVYHSWQPSPLLRQVLSKAAQRSPALRILSIHESDPRPVLKFVLSLSPTIATVLDSTMNGQFENRLIPNSQAFVEPLYPNVAITTDDGRRVRIDGYKSAPFPLDSSLSLVTAGLYFFVF